MGAPRKLSLALLAFNGYSANLLRAPAWLKLALSCVVAGFLASCALQPTAPTAASKKHRRLNVRTTAYCSREAGGRRNAVGDKLSGRLVRSAASDWSRFPLGTRFRIVQTEEEYIIDDYGTALVGTNTIDLYKTSSLEMRRWGVRHVDIDILEWGSDEASMKVLKPRAKHATARRMLVALAKKKTPSNDRFASIRE
jgi:3D (Asp-Asp-Asp) domain-containing protein